MDILKIFKLWSLQMRKQRGKLWTNMWGTEGAGSDRRCWKWYREEVGYLENIKLLEDSGEKLRKKELDVKRGLPTEQCKNIGSNCIDVHVFNRKQVWASALNHSSSCGPVNQSLLTSSWFGALLCCYQRVTLWPSTGQLMSTDVSV